MDLIEVRFIVNFRLHGVSLQTLRRFAAKMRADTKRAHPLALSKEHFLTETLGVLGEQYEMYEMIEDVLAKNVSFDAATHLAMQWRPLAGDFPDVVVDPRFAYGHPVISNLHVPTITIFRAWKAEHGDRAKVAEWFDIAEDQVVDAVQFEIRLNGGRNEANAQR